MSLSTHRVSSEVLACSNEKGEEKPSRSQPNHLLFLLFPPPPPSLPLLTLDEDVRDGSLSSESLQVSLHGLSLFSHQVEAVQRRKQKRGELDVRVHLPLPSTLFFPYSLEVLDLLALREFQSSNRLSGLLRVG